MTRSVVAMARAMRWLHFRLARLVWLARSVMMATAEFDRLRSMSGLRRPGVMIFVLVGRGHRRRQQQRKRCREYKCAFHEALLNLC
jgi:hypothetical protein